MALDPQQYEPLEDDAPAPLDRLSFIRPGRRTHPGPQRFVKVLRRALPVTAVVVLLALIAWPILHKDKLSAIVMKNIPDLVIKNLNFTGLDDKNEPYSLTAAKATRPGGINNIYDFDQPKGEITLANGSWLSGKAQYGRFNQDSHRLWLGGDVQLFHDKGYQFTTDEAQVDINDHNAWGSKPVLIQGGFGEIEGQGFRLVEGGKVMVVTGPAHASLDLRTAGSSDKPAGTAR